MLKLPINQLQTGSIVGPRFFNDTGYSMQAAKGKIFKRVSMVIHYYTYKGKGDHYLGNESCILREECTSTHTNVEGPGFTISEIKKLIRKWCPLDPGVNRRRIRVNNSDTSPEYFAIWLGTDHAAIALVEIKNYGEIIK